MMRGSTVTNPLIACVLSMVMSKVPAAPWTLRDFTASRVIGAGGVTMVVRQAAVLMPMLPLENVTVAVGQGLPLTLADCSAMGEGITLAVRQAGGAEIKIPVEEKETMALSQALPLPEQPTGSVAINPAADNLTVAVGHETPLTTIGCTCACAGIDSTAISPTSAANIAATPPCSVNFFKNCLCIDHVNRG